MKKIIETIDKATDSWSKGETIRWNFGGGESYNESQT